MRKLDDAFLVLVGLLVAMQILNVFAVFNLSVFLQDLTLFTIGLGGVLLIKNMDSIFTSLQKEKESELTRKKPSWKYWGALMALASIAFWFRAVQMKEVGLYVDDFHSLVGAISLLNHGTTVHFQSGIAQEPYTRFYAYIWTLYKLFGVFGQSLFVARLPGVIFGAITVIAMYFVGAGINRKVGLIAATLWAISPWAITLSHYIREYAIFPFFYLLSALLLFSTVRYLTSVFIEGKIKNPGRLIGILLLACFPLYYAFVLDFHSTFKQVFLIYGVAAIYFLYGLYSSDKIKKFVKWIMPLFALGILGVVIVFWIKEKVFLDFDIKPQFKRFYFLEIMGDNPKNWFYDTGLYTYWLLLGLGLMGSCLTLVRKKFKIAFYYTLIFLSYLYVFTFHFDRYNKARYGFSIHLWLIPMLAFGVWLLYRILIHSKAGLRKVIATLAMTLLLLMTFSPINTYHGIYSRQDGQDPISGEFLRRFDGVKEKYGDELKNAPVLCTLCGHLLWENLADLNENQLYATHTNNSADMKNAIEQIGKYEHGWMILSTHRDKEAEPLNEDKEFYGMKFDFVEKIDTFYLYRW